MVNTGIVEINTRCSDLAFQSCSSELYIDEKFTGYTPIQLFLPVGDHNYKIIKPGYFSHHPPSSFLMSGIINVQKGLKRYLDIDIVSDTLSGGTSMNSSPDGAQIFIDGEKQNMTAPAVIQGLPIGNHKYRMTLPGYADIDGTFTTIVGEPTYVYNTFTQLKDFGTLYIHPTPVLYGINVPYILQGAKIYIDNIDTGKLIPSPITGLTKGIHTFRVERAGTIDREGMFIINGGDTLLISIYPIIQPKTGMLAIYLSPFIGDARLAKVYIDDKDTGQYTNVRYALPEGTHTYRIQLEGFEIPEGKFEIVENRITTITPHICRIGTPKRGSIEISSNPSGALVAVDDVYLGQYTPTSVKHLPHGDYTYKLSKPGYSDHTGSITISNEDTIIIDQPLVQTDTILEISCNVIAAMVYIDNHTEGWTTPTEIIGLTPGIHTYRLVIPETYGNGFDDAVGTFVIEKGRTTRVSTTMQITKDKHYGNLTVGSAPNGARVFIDDVDTRSTTPYDVIAMSSGVHKVRLTLPGYNDWNGTVNIIQGSIVSILENMTIEKV